MKCVEEEWDGRGVSGLHGMPWLLLGLGCAFSLIRGTGWAKTRASRATNSRSLQDVKSQWNDNYATTWQSDSSSVLCFRCILYGRLLNIVLLQPTPVVVFVLLLSPWHTYVYLCMCEYVYANWWLLFVFGEFPCSTRTVHRAKTRKSVENPF